MKKKSSIKSSWYGSVKNFKTCNLDLNTNLDFANMQNPILRLSGWLKENVKAGRWVQELSTRVEYKSWVQDLSTRVEYKSRVQKGNHRNLIWKN